LPRLPISGRVRRRVTLVFICLWLLPVAGFFLWSLTGDVPRHPTAYLWMWDMFPSYDTQTRERMVVAETEAGAWKRIYPGPEDRFQLGGPGKFHRFELYYSLDEGEVGERFRAAVRKNFLTASRDETFTRALLVEKSYPARMNLSDELYEAEYGEPHPHRYGWKILEEIPLDEFSSSREATE
jgi:hypothetical protein